METVERVLHETQIEAARKELLILIEIEKDKSDDLKGPVQLENNYQRLVVAHHLAMSRARFDPTSFVSLAKVFGPDLLNNWDETMATIETDMASQETNEGSKHRIRENFKRIKGLVETACITREE